MDTKKIEKVEEKKLELEVRRTKLQTKIKAGKAPGWSR